MSAVQQVSTAEFVEKVLKSDKTVLVDFYADWCGPCRQLAPQLEQFAGESPETTVVKVNIDREPALASRYGVSAVPTLLVFRNGVVANQRLGYANKAQLADLVG